MQGLGPKGSSLLERVGSPLTIIDDNSTVADIEREQKARSKTRLVDRIQHAQKHKKPTKPLAPVKQVDNRVGYNKRAWLWRGEAIPSMSLIPGHLYSSAFIRLAGFRLPKLEKRGK